MRSARIPSRDRALWPRPAPEIVKLIRSLAVDDARRDHDAAIEAAQARRDDDRQTCSIERDSRLG